jgi:hypothetical protein
MKKRKSMKDLFPLTEKKLRETEDTSLFIRLVFFLFANRVERKEGDLIHISKYLQH